MSGSQFQKDENHSVQDPVIWLTGHPFEFVVIDALDRSF
jgi:hypothetical protein